MLLTIVMAETTMTVTTMTATATTMIVIGTITTADAITGRGLL